MQTIEMCFSDLIERYRQFKESIFLLIRKIPLLSPVEINNHCADLTTLQRELTATSNQLCLLMEGMDPEFLDTPVVGELQRAIDKSVLACASLQAELRAYRNTSPLLA